MTASFAPPCSGPLRAPIAAVTALYWSDMVEVTTRAVNVEALNECSMYRISEVSKARVISFEGTEPKVMWKKLST